MTVPDIVEFVADPQLLGLTPSEAQETLLRAIYGPSHVRKPSSSSTGLAPAARMRQARRLERSR